MSADGSAAIKAYRDALDTMIIHWARGLRDSLHEISDEMLTKLASEPEQLAERMTDSWRDAS